MIKKDRGLLLYYLGVFLFFLFILFLVRYIVNNTRMWVGYKEEISPVEIHWSSDSDILRVQDPFYLRDEYYLIDYDEKSKIRQDIELMNELFGDSTKSTKGSVMNLEAPYVLWKHKNTDTLSVHKGNHLLKFKIKKVNQLF